MSLIGVVLVTTSGILWLLTLPAYWRGEVSSPYIGILLFIGLPSVFVAGLILIPGGIAFAAWKRRKAGDSGPFVPRGGELRRLAIFVGITTGVNLLMGGQFTYRAVTYMDTVSFCGQTCHKVMDPEYTAYSNSPHARVACAECHIGAGASFFVKSKLSGTGQLLAVMFNNYPRPIPSPVQALRPARETCEQCHWPRMFEGNKFFVHTEYAPDQQNTPSTTVALMKIGGRNFSGSVGIHGAHVYQNARMDYVSTDGRRQVIPQVTYTDPNGKVTVFNDTSVKVKPEDLAGGEHREMDCMDCHNRPTHIFHVPERAIDSAMDQGGISSKLPFIKKQVLEVLKHDYPDHATAENSIAKSLDNFYRTSYPQVYASEHTALETTIKTVQTIYAQNIFPDMKITWGTYPNNLGHTDFPGCFRCHDGNHSSADGRTISNDCATCHDLLAVSEKDPKILSSLGINVPAQNPTGGAQGK
jgi:NapC/NirT cytochrome c family, N-terminal region